MTQLWHDAVEWADRVPRGVKVHVGDVEQEVFDRAPYILYRRERLQGLWRVCRPRSTGNQIVVALSGFAPIAGGLAFMGDTQFRNMRSGGLSEGVAVQVVWIYFLVGFLCQALLVAGWLRVGRRSRESDSTLSGMLVAGSGLALVAAAARDGVEVSDIHLWPAWACLIGAVVSIAAFVLGRSDRQLPAVDVDQLADDEREALIDERDAALKIAAKRQVVRLRTVNRAVGTPLGSLVARPRD